MKTDLPPLLIPTPRRLELTGGRAAVDAKCAAERVDDRVHLEMSGDEAYRLRITHSVQAPVLIEARGEAGVRHARATLAQLERQYGEMLPCLVIEDGPAIARRGYMLDVSRDRVPTMEHLFAIVDVLASLKYNHLQLYTEHTFAYAGHEEVWCHASPLTPAEVRELDSYCRVRGVELAANQNCFGHLGAWLNLPRYRDLAETHGTWSFEIDAGGGAMATIERRGPFSLCPVDPGSLALVEDLLGQLLPCFSSPLVNIGCDETFDVGTGRSAKTVEARGGGSRGRAAVAMEYVAKICALVERFGGVPLFWADIALQHPELARLAGGDAVRLAWGYEPDADWGRWLEALGPERTWVCPGTSTWRSITGRTTERNGNIAGAGAAAVRSGAPGFLLTDWGDGGHRQVWPISLPALACGAQAAWSGCDSPPDERAVSLQVLKDDTLRSAAWLDALGDVDLPLRRVSGRRAESDKTPRPLRNASALYVDLHMPLHAASDDDAMLRRGAMMTSVQQWEVVAGRVAELAGSVPRGLDELVERELHHAVRVAGLAAERGMARRRAGGIGRATAERLAEGLGEVIEEHSALWRARSRPGGLGASCGHYARIVEDLRA